MTSSSLLRASRVAGWWLLLAAAPWLHAGTPAWVKEAAATPLPAYARDTAAVLLLDEETLIVDGNGQARSSTRRVYKILRPEGRVYGRIREYFDSETSISSLKAW